MTTRMLALAFLLAATSAQAECYADYKARRGDPMRLHYGVIRLPDAVCDDRAAARRRIAERIGRDGWQLLSVEGIFGESGLDQRRRSAGEFFLRY